MNDRHHQGATWRPPLTFLTALVAALAMIATIAPATVDDESVSVGVVSPSMIDMLDGESTSGAVTLSELRDLTLRGWTGSDGSGIDVALIDTGVAPVDGLDGDNVVHGPDLSDEGTHPQVAFLDTYGHGTHMAGIIAGQRANHRGIAPGARVVSVKVAGEDGTTTVPQVIAGIDWVIENAQSNGMNIRVLNLSLGQTGVTSNQGDLLSAAVERAWDAGIFVVVAAGNTGDQQTHLDSPAISPYVMAIGAVDTTAGFEFDDGEIEDASIPSWSARGDGSRNPDIAAPGRSIASYRVPGSTIDEATPSARFGVDLFRGSGTSQAAATVSGLAAVMLSDDPSLTNDDIKDTMKAKADSIEDASRTRVGDGFIDGRNSIRYPMNGNSQTHPRAAGASTGIVTPSGSTWSGGSWSGSTWSGSTWSGSTWSGGSWSGSTWSGSTWSGSTWSGSTWSGSTWSGSTWSGSTWSGSTWSGSTWSGSGWS